MAPLKRTFNYSLEESSRHKRHNGVRCASRSCRSKPEYCPELLPMRFRRMSTRAKWPGATTILRGTDVAIKNKCYFVDKLRRRVIGMNVTPPLRAVPVAASVYQPDFTVPRNKGHYFRRSAKITSRRKPRTNFAISSIQCRFGDHACCVKK